MHDSGSCEGEGPSHFDDGHGARRGPADRPNPWRRLGQMAEATLRWAHLPPGLRGLTDHRTGTVTSAEGMCVRQRRCVLTHELEHVDRGPVPRWLQPREERVVDATAARWLLPDVREVGEALAWGAGLDEAAYELDVTPAMLSARLVHLHPAERAYLERRLTHLEQPVVVHDAS